MNAPTDQIKNIIYRGDLVTSAQDLSSFYNMGLELNGQRQYVGPREHSYSPRRQLKNHFIDRTIDYFKNILKK